MAGASLVVFNAEWSAAAAPAPCPSIVVRPPVDPAAYRTTPGDAFTLVNLSEPKGVKVAWRLAEQAPDVPFLGVRGGYGEQIVPRAPNFTVIDQVRDMRAVYGRTRVLLMPSLHESWGRVGVEAMCSGIPVIAAPTPGLLESLGSAGLFVDRTDERGWLDAVRRLRDPAEWAIWSQRALQRSAELDPAADIDLFIESITALTTKEHHAP
jgi:glycosyltransferase involved in cell wall biosynthesis